MSTTPVLLRRLVDDAAVFPPGNAPLGRAWGEHRALMAGPHLELIGPLLVPATEVSELIRVVAADPPGADAPVSITLIARRGVALDDAHDAVRELAGLPAVRVTALEVAAEPGWQQALTWGLRLAVEVHRDAPAELDELATALASASPDAFPVVGKLRTQATAEDPVPTAASLSAFITGCRDRGLAFKLTGGLHHAVATDAEHGALNVLLATELASSGADPEQVAGVLDERDGRLLAARARGLSDAAAASAREAFVSYGCCGVLDPIGELHDLGLV